MTKLITFEGIEGVGKSTQIEMLNSFIVDSGYSSQILREPGSTRFGEDVRNLLLNSDHDISSNSELLLMFAARSELVNAFLKETKTDFILCDRFYDASIAYQGYGRGLDLKFINSLINFINCPEPDITFLLDLDPAEGFKRKSSDKMDRIESSGLEFFDRVRNGYLNQAHANPQRIKVLDASKNVTSINLKIIEFAKIFL
tara:strand:- start:5129 stop:5728 length:600 start_codon:yes stop_codon:yes gene_type:complete